MIKGAQTHKRPASLLAKYQAVETVIREMAENGEIKDGKKPNFSEVARRAQVDQRTCVGLWKKGWPRHDWAPPLSQLSADALRERSVRAQRLATLEKNYEEEQKRAQQAKADALKAQQEEADMVSFTRKTTVALAGGVLPPLVKAAIALATEVQNQISPPPGSAAVAVVLDVQTKVRLLRDIAIASDKIAAAAKQTLENERLRVGDPTKIVQLDITTMTPQEAVEELQRLAEDVEIRRQLPPAQLVPAQDEKYKH